MRQPACTRISLGRLSWYSSKASAGLPSPSRLGMSSVLHEISRVSVMFSQPQALPATSSAPAPQLTTYFTPPAECLDGPYTSHARPFGTLLCTKAHTGSCFPPSFIRVMSRGAYSRGVCPHGYNVGDAFAVPAAASVTSGVCCPRYVTGS